MPSDVELRRRAAALTLRATKKAQDTKETAPLYDGAVMLQHLAGETKTTKGRRAVLAYAETLANQLRTLEGAGRGTRPLTSRSINRRKA